MLVVCIHCGANLGQVPDCTDPRVGSGPSHGVCSDCLPRYEPAGDRDAAAEWIPPEAPRLALQD